MRTLPGRLWPETLLLAAWLIWRVQSMNGGEWILPTVKRAYVALTHKLQVCESCLQNWPNYIGSMERFRLTLAWRCPRLSLCAPPPVVFTAFSKFLPVNSLLFNEDVSNTSSSVIYQSRLILALVVVLHVYNDEAVQVHVFVTIPCRNFCD